MPKSGVVPGRRCHYQAGARQTIVLLHEGPHGWLQLVEEGEREFKQAGELQRFLCVLIQTIAFFSPVWLDLPTWLLHPEKRRAVQRSLWWNVHGHVRLGVEKIRVGQQILLTSTRQEEKKTNWHFKRPPWLVCLAWRWLIIHHHRKGTWFGNALQWTISICAFTESIQVIKAEGRLA